MIRRPSGFAEIQREYFEDVDAARFRWTTSAEGFADTEDELLSAWIPTLGSPCLEIGCGEGNNLTRLAGAATCTGVDRSPAKLAFASRALPGCSFCVADASDLPFSSRSFRAVVIRDLLHHVPDPRRVLEEAARVLASGGDLGLLEPNGRNPLVWLQTRIVAAEAGARDSNPQQVRRLLEGLPLDDLEVQTRLPLPLRRVLLHYRYGLPALGRRRLTRRALIALESALGRLVPEDRWSYVMARARRR